MTIQEKALRFLEAQRSDSEKSFLVLMLLVQRTGLSVAECQERIEMLAAGRPA